MSDTVTITITDQSDDVTISVTDNTDDVTISVTDGGSGGSNYSVFDGDNSTATQVDTSITLSTYTARADVNERIRVFTGGRARKYNRPWGWGVSGTNVTFVGADGSTPVALINEDYVIIIRRL